MRKIAFFVLSVMLSITFISCSSTSSDVCEEELNSYEISSDDSYAKLNNEIIELNSTLIKHEQGPRKGLGRFFKRLFNVVLSDVGGAIKGALNGDNIWQSAQGASMVAAKKDAFLTAKDIIESFENKAPRRAAGNTNDSLMTSFVQPKDVALNDVMLEENPADATPIDSLGYYHNLVIYSAIEEHNSVDYWRNLSDQACVLELNEEIIKTIPTSCYNDTELSQETIDFCSFIGSTSAECEDYTSMLKVMQTKYPELKNLLSVISQYFKGYELVKSEEEWTQYCKSLIKLISISDLSEHEKNTLKAGITVGYASSKLWKIPEE